MKKEEELYSVALWLIKTLCLDTNATKATYKVKGLTHHDKILGDYQITVKKLKPKEQGELCE